jgi:hypothetical protein
MSYVRSVCVCVYISGEGEKNSCTCVCVYVVGGAYTSNEDNHVTLALGEKDLKDWSCVRIYFSSSLLICLRGVCVYFRNSRFVTLCERRSSSTQRRRHPTKHSEKKSQPVIITPIPPVARFHLFLIFCTHQRPTFKSPGLSLFSELFIFNSNKKPGEWMNKSGRTTSSLAVCWCQTTGNHQLIIRNYKSLIMNHLERKTMSGFFRRVGL